MCHCSTSQGMLPNNHSRFLLQYLSKQNLALREVSDSRVKVYEQLEENISELEAANKKLVEEGKEDKGKIKR